MFGNFGSRDFAKVLLVEEMSQVSLSQMISKLMRDGVESKVVADFLNVQRGLLGLKEVEHGSYLEILTDDLIVNSVRYYGKCEELKLVLALYSIEHKEAREDGGRVDMFKLLRLVRGLDKFLSRARKGVYDFSGYDRVIREKM